MVMNAEQLSTYVDPILQDPTLDHIATIRFGTKSVAYWPYRFVTDPDADDTLRLFQRIVDSGRGVSIMAHFSHPNELSGPVPQVVPSERERKSSLSRLYIHQYSRFSLLWGGL